MDIYLIIFSTLMGLAATMSALGKITKMAQPLDTLKSVGVKPSQVNLLAGLEVLGVLGLVIGIWAPLIGQLAALGLVGYFTAAAIAHLRASHEARQILPALFLMVIALTTFVLQLAR
jgi:uncharacterized membrane protein YphA (DoxX/SURF4 family)